MDKEGMKAILVVGGTILAIIGLVSVLVFVFFDVSIQEKTQVGSSLVVMGRQNHNSVKDTFIDTYSISSYRDQNKLVLQFEDPNECLRVETSSGISMKPIYPEKSYSIMDYCYSPERIDVGDVINYLTDNNRRTHHRVIEIDSEKKRFLTKGDGNGSVDGWIHWNEMISKEVTWIDSFDEFVYEQPDLNFTVTSSEGKFLKIGFAPIPDISFIGDPRIIIESEDGWLVTNDSNTFRDGSNVFWVASKYYDLNSVSDNKITFVLSSADRNQSDNEVGK